MIEVSNRGRRMVIGLAAVALIASAGWVAQAQTLSDEQQMAAAGAFTSDPAHSNISFTVDHMGITKVHGRFDDFTAKVKLDPARVEDSSVEFTAKVASVDTNQPQRDAHLKSDAFFDAAKFPEITFKSTRVNKRRKGYAAVGTLTMHGVSHEIVLPFTATPLLKGAEGGMHVGVETSIDLKRSDYGINAYAGVIGDEIPVTIELDLLKDGSVPPAPAGAPGK